LDLARIDVFATADDHVLDPPDDVAVAGLINHAEITGMHPTLGVDRLGRALRIVPVAQHHRIAAGADLAGNAARRHLAGLIDDLHLQMRLHPADGRDAALD